MAKNVLCNNNNNIDTDKDTIDITNDNTKVLGPGENRTADQYDLE